MNTKLCLNENILYNAPQATIVEVYAFIYIYIYAYWKVHIRVFSNPWKKS